jgi:hypothetical protein
MSGKPTIVQKRIPDYPPSQDIGIRDALVRVRRNVEHGKLNKSYLKRERRWISEAEYDDGQVWPRAPAPSEDGGGKALKATTQAGTCSPVNCFSYNGIYIHTGHLTHEGDRNKEVETEEDAV